ncbi:histidine kinase [uncultured Actinomyces sp.]|uniref:sensor histidine kinase n=1 Tax=uncultured Actinomyces sp. TaxID=249061 RepID=UPI0028D16A3E|nr:histidine kinase [uncultured Actinomyces sp.]
MLRLVKRFAIRSAQALGTAFIAFVTWEETGSWGIAAGAVLALFVLRWRRERPDAVLGVHFALYALQLCVAAKPQLPADMAITVSLYSIGRWGKRRLTPMWVAAVFSGSVLVAWIYHLREPGSVPLSQWAENMTRISFGQLCIAAIAWGLGRFMKQRSQLRASRQAAEEQRRAAREAALRNEIAREVHDVVGHALALIAVQAEAGRYLAAGSEDIALHPADRLEQAAQALGKIRTTARSALAETRSLTRALAVPPQPTELGDTPEPAEAHGSRPASPVTDTPLRPVPGLKDLPRLVNDVRATGLPVSLAADDQLMSQEGRQEGYGLLGTPVELALYRTVQESLTNVLKHAEAAAVDVRLEYRADGIVLTIADYPGPSGSQTSPRAGEDRLSLADHGGVSSEAAPAGTGGGQGLVNLRQRLEAVGGTLEAGPRPGGGFVVRARVPVEPSTSVFVNPRSEAT